jgi:hypothetical protein
MKKQIITITLTLTQKQILITLISLHGLFCVVVLLTLFRLLDQQRILTEQQKWQQLILFNYLAGPRVRL